MGELDNKRDYGIVVYKGVKCTIYEQNNGPGSKPSYILKCEQGNGLVTVGSYADFFHAHRDALVFEENSKKAEQTNQVTMENTQPDCSRVEVKLIETIRAALTAEEFRGFCKGSAIKYIYYDRFDGGVEDIKNAQWYLEQLHR